MKKLLLLSAFALSFTLFSCTADENDPQPVSKTAKISTTIQTTALDGPGDGPKFPPPPPSSTEK